MVTKNFSRIRVVHNYRNKAYDISFQMPFSRILNFVYSAIRSYFIFPDKGDVDITCFCLRKLKRRINLLLVSLNIST